MIVISVRQQEFDYTNVQDCNNLRVLCTALELEPVVDLRPHGKELLASKAALTKLTNNPAGLGFLQEFCNVSDEMLYELVLVYNPELEFVDLQSPQEVQAIEVFKELIDAYVKARGTVN